MVYQSSSDIHRKLKKTKEGPQTPIPDLVKMAFKVLNTREEVAELKRQARLQQKVQLQTQASVGARRKGEPTESHLGLASDVAPRDNGPVNVPIPRSQRGNSLNVERCATGNPPAGSRGILGASTQRKPWAGKSSLSTTRIGWWLTGPRLRHPLSQAKPRVLLQVAGKPISFLLGTGATDSIVPSYSGASFPSPVAVMGTDGTSSIPRTAPLLSCSLDGFSSSHSFLRIPSCPAPFRRKSWHLSISFSSAKSGYPPTYPLY